MSDNIRVIDIDTGVDHSEEYTLRSRNQDAGYARSLEKERYRLESADRHWVASYHDPVEEVSKELTLIQTGALIKLIPYMRFKSEGKLIKDGKPLKQADIQRIFKRGKGATIQILKELSDKGVISILKEGRSNVFYISAIFHEKGSVNTALKFTKLYQVRTREITDDLALHEAGILYKILPYFHFSRYYLVSNPNEPDIDKLDYIGRDELADLIGMDRPDLTKAVNKLRSKGALMSTSSGKSVMFLVHPDVMFRQSFETEWTDAVREFFEPHMRK